MLRSSAALALEELAQREPFELSTWLSFTEHVSEPSKPNPGALFCIYERAVAALPGSYKLWRAYASAMRELAATYHPTHMARRAALDVSRRAAEALRASPVLWLDYIQHAIRERRWTEARSAANGALRALPISQHERVWALLLERLVGAKGVPPATSVLLLRRYAKLRPGHARERLFRHLVRARRWDEAVMELSAALADSAWAPEGEKTREQLWMELARVASRHPDEVVSVDVPALLRGAVAAARTDVGELWVVFGEYYLRKGMFDQARTVYEEAVSTAITVRDFAVIFEAYAKFEESLVTAAMEDVDTITEELKGQEDDDTLKAELKEASDTVEQLIERLEFLTNRRPMLLSDVVLRQNPHNVHEWHKRARMFKHAKDAPNVVDTYTKAALTVDPWRATSGRPHTLWLAFAHYYEEAGDLTSARRVMDKAVSNPEFFRSAEDLAAVWCEYAEMELRCNTPAAAREILLRGTTEPEKKRVEGASRKLGRSGSNAEAVVGAGGGNAIISHTYDNSSPAWNAYRSLRTWHFLIDLSQSIAGPEDVVKVHRQMLDMRLASAQTILSGAAYLESKRLFEQAFRLYDKAVLTMQWPEALTVWVVYLSKFVKRFGVRKLERARDLFEEALRSAPVTKKAGHQHPHPQLRLLYIMYAEMEEEHSLARHALAVLARAVKAVQEDDRASMYKMYIVKIATLYGVTKTRPVYEEALSSLTKPEDVLEFGLRYAAMENRLGEIDRARAVYSHTSQIANPRAGGIFAHFWKTWHDFELAHGSEDTFRDMLREKRAVQLKHKGVVIGNAVLLGMTESGNGDKGIRNMVEAETIEATTTEVDSAEKAKEKDGTRAADEGVGADTKTAGPSGNAEEIDLDLTDDDEGREPTDAKAPDAPTTPESGAPKDTSGSGNVKGGGKLNIVQRELPEAVKRLIGVAHDAQKRKREEEDEDRIEENPVDRGGDGNASGLVKRQRQSINSGI